MAEGQASDLGQPDSEEEDDDGRFGEEGLMSLEPKAGLEFDAWLNEHVMGRGDGITGLQISGWSPTTDISAAMEIVFELGEADFELSRAMNGFGDKDKRCRAQFGTRGEGIAGTPQMAICLAAKKYFEWKKA